MRCSVLCLPCRCLPASFGACRQHNFTRQHKAGSRKQPRERTAFFWVGKGTLSQCYRVFFGAKKEKKRILIACARTLYLARHEKQTISHSGPFERFRARHSECKTVRVVSSVLVHSIASPCVACQVIADTHTHTHTTSAAVLHAHSRPQQRPRSKRF